MSDRNMLGDHYEIKLHPQNQVNFLFI
jgi:hypothetical protein